MAVKDSVGVVHLERARIKYVVRLDQRGDG